MSDITAAQCPGTHQTCQKHSDVSTPLSLLNSLSKKKKMLRKHNRNDSDELARWVFGFARIFGFWPFTNRISDQSQLDLRRPTVPNYLWLLVLFLTVWCQFTWYAGVLSRFSAIRRMVAMLIFMAYIMCVISNLLITIWRRQNLSKILSINQTFERKVSFPFFHILR